MPLSLEELKALLRNPRESFDVELKSWIDPRTKHGKAVIAKACFALRNNNGGVLIFGFKNDPVEPAPDPPENLHDLFHHDRIQSIIAKHASHPFEVAVELVESDENVHPTIQIPGGVMTPVAVKSGILNEEGSLLKENAVYCRTLHSNNTISSSEARWSDWERIVKVCFDNREADIGAFFRRHLTGTNIKKLVDALYEASAPDPTPATKVANYLIFGKSRFDSVCDERDVTIPEVGTRQAAIVIEAPNFRQYSLNEFQDRVQAGKPHHTGWTPWMDSRSSRNPNDRPYVFENGLEACLIDLRGMVLGQHVEFWRMEPAGRFYHLRGLEDDLTNPHPNRPEPGTELDFLLQISRTAEIISIGLSFARSLGSDESETSVAYAFGWTGLKGRYLTSWAEPDRLFISRDISHQDAFQRTVVIPLSTPESAIAPYVESIIYPLFTLFDAGDLDTSLVEDIVRNTISRRF